MTDPERRLAELLRESTPEPPSTIDLGRLARQARSAPSRRGSVFGRWSAPALAAAAVVLVVAAVAVTVATQDGDEPPVAGPAGTGATVSAGTPSGLVQPLDTAPTVEPRAGTSDAPQTLSAPTSPPSPASTGRPMGEQASPTLVESVELSPDQRTLVAHFFGAPGPKAAPCGADYVARVSETADNVLLVVTADKNPKSKMCVAMAAERTVTAQLTAPLGDREVLSADKKAVPVTRR